MTSCGLFFSDSLAFAVEPIFASLANVLGNYDRLPVNVPLEIKVRSILDIALEIVLMRDQQNSSLSLLFLTKNTKKWRSRRREKDTKKRKKEEIIIEREEAGLILVDTQSRDRHPLVIFSCKWLFENIQDYV